MGERVRELVARASAELDAAPAFRYWVPGRLELFGKHTDYAGGRSLTAAIERGFAFVATPIDGATCTVADAVRRETVFVPLDGDLDGGNDTAPGWSRYAITAIQRIAADARAAGATPVALSIAFASDLPPAAGLSSSTALITGLVLCMIAASDVGSTRWGRETLVDPLAFGAYLGTVERGDDRAAGVGTEGGCQDSTAILAAEPNAIGAFRYRPSRLDGRVRWPQDWGLVIGVSGVVAAKTEGARERYNRASRLATRAAEARGASCLGAIPDGDHAVTAGATGDVERRALHFVRESESHVPAALDALRTADRIALGETARESTRDAATLLDNQTPDTLALVDLAYEAGAFAASPFGAGFGGSVWAAVDREELATFPERWGDAYRRRAPHLAERCDFFVTRLGSPATRLDPVDAR